MFFNSKDRTRFICMFFNFVCIFNRIDFVCSLIVTIACDLFLCSLIVLFIRFIYLFFFDSMWLSTKNEFTYLQKTSAA